VSRLTLSCDGHLSGNEIVSTGTFNNVNELTALSGGGVVGFTGTTTEDAAVTLGGQAAQTSLVGTRFEKAVTLPAGTNTVTVAAVDPSGNTNSKNYRVVVSSGAAQSFTYDANGNMTSDGTRTYAWDAENRLIKITEGTKTTDIEYDGFHHWTRIVERNGATTVSDRRFIWDGNTLVEQRNGTSTTAAQRYLPQSAAEYKAQRDTHANCFISVQMDCIRRADKKTSPPQSTRQPRCHG